MASLLSDGQKSLINATLDNVHDTFKKEFTAFLEVPVEQTGSSFNPLFGGGSAFANTAQTELTGVTITGRVKYIDKQSESELGSEFHLEGSEGMARVKVDSINLNNLLIAKRIELDDYLWQVDSDPKPIGPFGENYFMIYMKREN